MRCSERIGASGGWERIGASVVLLENWCKCCVVEEFVQVWCSERIDVSVVS